MRAKHGIRVLGLAMLAAALGTLAFAAAGAQAQLPGESKVGVFLVNLGAVSGLTLTIKKLSGQWKILVPGRDLKILCKVLDSGGETHGWFNWLEINTLLKCKSYSRSTGEELPCELAGLETISFSSLALPILHGSANFVLFEPQVAGGNFTTVSYKAGTECPLPPTNPVTGSMAGQLGALDAITQSIFLSEAIQLLTGDVLKFGLSTAYITATVNVELAGEHTGQKFGVH